MCTTTYADSAVCEYRQYAQEEEGGGGHFLFFFFSFYIQAVCKSHSQSLEDRLETPREEEKREEEGGGGEEEGRSSLRTQWLRSMIW